MRADRLLSILLLLQGRGRMNARQLAKELEVSERTIYRDITALSTAGVPVYSEKGAGGGFVLVESYRMRLTGLTQDEVRALFMLELPAPLADLGLIPALKTALLKLSAALPQAQRLDESRVRQRIHLETASEAGDPAALPHLQTIYQAVWQDQCLLLSEKTWFAEIRQRLVEPLALVAQAGTWNLVYQFQGQRYVRRLSEVLDVQISSDTFTRPPDFDLQEFWRAWLRDVTRLRTPFKAVLRVSLGLHGELSRQFGSQFQAQLLKASPPDERGWLTIELTFESFEDARQRILGFGGAGEVLEPLPLRVSILDYAEQILHLYMAQD